MKTRTYSLIDRTVGPPSVLATCCRYINEDVYGCQVLW